LCNWVEHEVPVEEGTDIENLAKTLSVFAPEMLGLPQPDKKNGRHTEENGRPRLVRA